MTYSFEEINEGVKNNPEIFINSCDNAYNLQLENAALKLKENIHKSRIILLSGPSGSGKTTTAKKIASYLSKIGITAHAVSLDNYYRTIELSFMPKDEDGNLDYESPDILDIPLLVEHFKALDEGMEIRVPKFEFARQARNDKRSSPLKLAEGEVAIFEGIHALNDMLADYNKNALKIFVSADSNINDKDGLTVFSGNWTRLLRRVTRDCKFRGANPSFTMSVWSSVRRGEHLYIEPFKKKADIMINSSLPYEVPVLRKFCREYFNNISDTIKMRDEFLKIGEALDRFADLDESLLRDDSLLREFIGGSKFSYSF